MVPLGSGAEQAYQGQGRQDKPEDLQQQQPQKQQQEFSHKISISTLHAYLRGWWYLLRFAQRVMEISSV